MRPSVPAFAGHVHRVLINFPKRSAPGGAHTPHPHPSAPDNIRASFQEFLSKIENSKSSNSPATLAKSSKLSDPSVVDFWNAPSRFTRTLAFEEAEIDAVQSGGASA